MFTVVKWPPASEEEEAHAVCYIFPFSRLKEKLLMMFLSRKMFWEDIQTNYIPGELETILDQHTRYSMSCAYDEYLIKWKGSKPDRFTTREYVRNLKPWFTHEDHAIWHCLTYVGLCLRDLAYGKGL